MSASQMPTGGGDGAPTRIVLDGDDRPTRHGSAAGEPPGRSGYGSAAVEPPDRSGYGSAETLTGRSPASDSSTAVLGRYRLGRRLGTGAFGTVYTARDERLERDVAVKVLPRERIVGGRFEREARAAARLQHPGIVTLYEAAVDDDGAYLVSELVRGTTLDRVLDSGGLSDQDVLRIGAALADALEHAHALGVIHRDVKPSNVLVPARTAPGSSAAKLTDFGVARVVGGDRLTRAGDVIGTADYMAPEQAAGRSAGPAADLYALALILYEALTGVNPVREARRGRARRLGVHLPPLRRQRRDLPRGLGAAVDRALHPREEARGGLSDLRAALIEALPTSATTTGIVTPRFRAGRDRPRAVRTSSGRRRQAAAAIPEPRAPSAAEPQAGGAYDSRQAARRRWRPRAVASLSAALAAGWLSAHLLGHAPLAPVAAGLLAAGATLLAPRLGWWATVAALAVLAAASGRPGAALVLVALTGATSLALVGAGELAPIPAAAAALGLLGIAPAWPALAGTAPLPALRRAGLAASGLLWAVAAGALTARPVLWRPPRLPPPHAWAGSLQVALHDLLIPAAHSALFAAALVWAVAAALLPLARRLPPAAALPVIATWSAATIAATEAAGARPLHGAALGALLGALLAGSPALAALARTIHDRRGDVPIA